jgi:hypothetical protein
MSFKARSDTKSIFLSCFLEQLLFGLFSSSVLLVETLDNKDFLESFNPLVSLFKNCSGVPNIE